jgi:hypothetical protein
MMKKFRKRPVIIEAIQFVDNVEEIVEWLNDDLNTPASFGYDKDKVVIFIETLEGVMTAQTGDWIIKGVNGEFYPCKPDIFEKTYEPVESEE